MLFLVANRFGNWPNPIGPKDSWIASCTNVLKILPHYSRGWTSFTSWPDFVVVKMINRLLFLANKIRGTVLPIGLTVFPFFKGIPL